jgi:hypothetical protein
VVVNLKQIEARIAKLEAAHRADRFTGMTEEEIEREALRLLEGLIGETGSFASVVAELAASDEPDLREGARATVEWFGERYGYTAPVSTSRLS